MRIEAICFTNAGFLLGEKLISSLSKCCEAAELSKGFGENGVSLGEWVKTRFNTADALVFIGSAAIAVRAIAPYISLKTTDPAVIAIDEKANFCIPLLSGHIGGANELSKKLAELTGAVPVITTATDINNLFAIDSWAVKNSIAIINPEKIKTVSSKLLAGRIVKLKSDFDIIGRLPDGFEISENDFDAIITSSYSENTNALCLVPPVAVIGVGCKRGSSQDKIENAVLQVLKKAGVYPQAVASICSINIKSDEAGIIETCKKYKYKFIAYTAEQLNKLEGCFSSSKFVLKTTGTDNVCERCAVLGSDGGRLIVYKTVFDGVTAALAVKDYKISFN